MSYYGYFEGIIDTWNKLEKRTPSIIKDMKEVIRQFNTSLSFKEIPEDKIEYLKKEFNRIYKEVYK